MNLTRTMKDLENVYSEKVTFPPKGTFELAKGAKEKKKAFISKPSGPAEAEGIKAQKSSLLKILLKIMKKLSRRI